MDETPKRSRGFFSPRVVISILAVLLLAAVGTGAYFYLKATANPQVEAKKELDQTIQAIGKLMVLPDETPTLATVADPSKLQDLPFFKNAKKGDKVLIYTHAQKAILYDPSINKIIEVAPVNLGNQGTNTVGQ